LGRINICLSIYKAANGRIKLILLRPLFLVENTKQELRFCLTIIFAGANQKIAPVNK